MWPSTAQERLFSSVVISHCSVFFFFYFIFISFSFHSFLFLVRDNEQIARSLLSVFPPSASLLLLLLLVQQEPPLGLDRTKRRPYVSLPLTPYEQSAVTIKHTETQRAAQEKKRKTPPLFNPSFPPPSSPLRRDDQKDPVKIDDDVTMSIPE